ncbi:hypothetical protein [Protaetiibacter mangrovi]|uniref:Lipoprotein n=1 Tax=Protaetiibacter mangrovi TaxID=2970926 RepID=A0ABT1ZE85_9MICO|nr:hypothetical protein [Protaetiibacter mangrovi]MCS0499021.1 hypothetical protein [Protaetiibacter mangrovi]
MRVLRASGVAAAACAVLVLTGCGAPDDAETPIGRDAASDYRCLAEHSPWIVDLDAAYDAWRDAAAQGVGVRAGDVTGSARLSFTGSADPRWRFSAERVAYELFLDDGSRESTTVSGEYSGDYRLSPSGGMLVLTSVRVDAADSAATATAADGTSGAVTVPAPAFPWDAGAGASLAFTCTEHRLIVDAVGGIPSNWNLYPE